MYIITTAAVRLSFSTRCFFLWTNKMSHFKHNILLLHHLLLPRAPDDSIEISAARNNHCLYQKCHMQSENALVKNVTVSLWTASSAIISNPQIWTIYTSSNNRKFTENYPSVLKSCLLYTSINQYCSNHTHTHTHPYTNTISIYNAGQTMALNLLCALRRACSQTLRQEKPWIPKALIEHPAAAVPAPFD